MAKCASSHASLCHRSERKGTCPRARTWAARKTIHPAIAPKIERVCKEALACRYKRADSSTSGRLVTRKTYRKPSLQALGHSPSPKPQCQRGPSALQGPKRMRSMGAVGHALLTRQASRLRLHPWAWRAASSHARQSSARARPGSLRKSRHHTAFSEGL